MTRSRPAWSRGVRRDARRRRQAVALPGVWAEVVGQDAQIAPLRAAVDRPVAMTHAWLITGPPGSGRSHAARAFAAALQCVNGGCGECKACKTALTAAHADVTLLATEKVTIGIEEVRDLSMLAQRSPSEGRWRVIIIEDADRMTERTSNVLLKAIEEPPPRTVWLLCAPHAHDVSVTIRSRCRVVALRTPPADVVARLLVERDGVDPDLARESARAAQSHIGIARRLARDPKARARRDQVLALATEVRGVGDAVLAAADLVKVAEDDAAAATEERDANEKAELLAVLGAETGTIPPALRAQVQGTRGGPEAPGHAPQARRARPGHDGPHVAVPGRGGRAVGRGHRTHQRGARGSHQGAGGTHRSEGHDGAHRRARDGAGSPCGERAPAARDRGHDPGVEAAHAGRGLISLRGTTLGQR